jgi:hypothetical protein
MGSANFATGSTRPKEEQAQMAQALQTTTIRPVPLRRSQRKVNYGQVLALQAMRDELRTRSAYPAALARANRKDTILRMSFLVAAVAFYAMLAAAAIG